MKMNINEVQITINRKEWDYLRLALDLAIEKLERRLNEAEEYSIKEYQGTMKTIKNFKKLYGNLNEIDWIKNLD